MESIDNNKVSKINLVWINFLKLFCQNQSDFSFEQNENGYVTYTIENIFNSSITLSSVYGFMSLIFKDVKCRDEFIDIVKLLHSDVSIEERQGIFPKEDFPSRIYLANKLTLSFYDIRNSNSDRVKFEDRIMVFQNVIDAVIRFKISKEKIDFFNTLED